MADPEELTDVPEELTLESLNLTDVPEELLNLMDLPDNALEDILLELDDTALSHMCKVNKRVAERCNDDTFWVRKLRKQFGSEVSLMSNRILYDILINRSDIEIKIYFKDCLYIDNDDDTITWYNPEGEIRDIIHEMYMEAYTSTIQLVTEELKYLIGPDPTPISWGLFPRGIYQSYTVNPHPEKKYLQFEPNAHPTPQYAHFANLGYLCEVTGGVNGEYVSDGNRLYYDIRKVFFDQVDLRLDEFNQRDYQNSDEQIVRYNHDAFYDSNNHPDDVSWLNN